MCGCLFKDDDQPESQADPCLMVVMERGTLVRKGITHGVCLCVSTSAFILVMLPKTITSQSLRNLDLEGGTVGGVWVQKPEDCRLILYQPKVVLQIPSIHFIALNLICTMKGIK